MFQNPPHKFFSTVYFSILLEFVGASKDENLKIKFRWCNINAINSKLLNSLKLSKSLETIAIKEKTVENSQTLSYIIKSVNERQLPNKNNQKFEDS